MYTNTARMTGLSGIDTEAMVTQLMRAESLRYNKLKANTQLLTWRQDAYRNVASSLQMFQNKFLSFTNSATNMRSTATFGGFSTTARQGNVDTNAATITTTGTSKAGEYSLKIEQLAAKETFRVGSTIGGVIESTLTDASRIAAGDSFHINMDGIRKTISFDSDDIANIGNNMDNLKQVLQNKIDTAFGLDTSASNGTQSKIEVRVDGGQLSFVPNIGHEVTINDAFSRVTAQTSNNDINNLTTGTNTLQITLGSETKTITIDTDATTDMENKSGLVAKINTALREQGLSGSVYASLDGNKITFTAINTAADIRIENEAGGNFLNQLGFDGDAVTVGHTSSLVVFGIPSGSSNKLDLNKSLGELFGDTIPANNVTFNLNGSAITYNSTTTLRELMTRINGSTGGFTLSYSDLKQEFVLEAKESGLSGSLSNMPADLRNIFGFKSAGEYSQAEIDAGVYVAPSDAVIELNGLRTTRNSNNFEIDGIKFQLNAITTEDIKINVVKDTTKGMEVIREFIDSYNTLIQDLNSQVRTPRAKSGTRSFYEPLTDEEKESMTDRQIENWEAKAQEGILYNDTIVRDITASMRTFLYQSVTLSDGSKLSLFEIGITTSSEYSDMGKLVIDEAKLTQALEDHGEKIADLFTKSSDISYSNKAERSARMASQGLSERINDIINDNINSTGIIAQRAGIKGTYSEGDNVIYHQLRTQGIRLTDMLAQLASKETYYYNMFSRMETAMNSANSQMAYLQAQFS